MFEQSVRKARERTLAAVSAYLQPDEEVHVVAMALERWRIGRMLLIAGIPLLPVLFLMELNEVSGLIQSVSLGLVFGVVGWITQIRATRHLVLTRRRLIAIGSTWNARPAGLEWETPRSGLALIHAGDASYGMRSITIRGPDETEHELTFARPWRTQAAEIEERLQAGSVLPPPPSPQTGP
jgi:hypothetical protein